MQAFLFGQIGVGKSSLGAAAAHAWGVTFHEADDDLPPALIAAIRARVRFDDTLRDEFAAILVSRLAALSDEHPAFILAQGLFYNRQRHQLLAAHPSLQFVWVRAQPSVIEDRLRTRAHPLADLSYARLANPHFEPPDFPCAQIDNDGSIEDGLRLLSSVLANARSAVG